MKSMRALTWMILTAGLLAAAGCGGGSAPVTDPADSSVAWPAWYQNPPEDDTVYLAKATATSQDPQFAVDKAELDAQARLASEVSARIQDLMTRFVEEVGSGAEAQLLDKSTSATKRVTEQTLVGARIRKQETVREGAVWRAFVLAEVPRKSADQALLGDISKDEEMYTRFRESQAFQALENAVGK
ncbi:MAG TPA: hypothetical protein PLL30_07275 [Candidatus Krumholzibacteria bacterium]|nr:hypothetical protein [Candidatus Krumholzibacteria bacterium]HPD71556.1 hypothetical protein [Candidatus Krumholzibacteria bacterium]HRY41511.1 hypothetical protein [Candidatus Krumholzibacteria bacterium]